MLDLTELVEAVVGNSDHDVGSGHGDVDLSLFGEDGDGKLVLHFAQTNSKLR